MGRTKRQSETEAASPTRAAKAAKLDAKDAATSKKPASKTAEKPASKSKVTDKPASKSKAKAPVSSSKATPKSAAKGKSKAALSAEDFKSKALPLHLSLTQTPPELGESEETKPSSSDPGFIASIPVQPATFKTGSYGWKGSRKLTIPLGDDGETVTVMININATVAGSKDASAAADKEDLVAAVKEDLDSGSESE